MKNLKHRNCLALRVRGKIVLNCNDKLLFFCIFAFVYCATSDYYFIVTQVQRRLFPLRYVITYPLTISAMTDIRSLRCTSLPLVFTRGGMATECNRVNKRMAEKIAEIRREPYASVMTYMRTKLRFALLRITLAVIRGFRGK